MNLPPAVADNHRQFERAVRSAAEQLRRAEHQLLGALFEAPIHEFERADLMELFRVVLDDSQAATIADHIDEQIDLWASKGATTT